MERWWLLKMCEEIGQNWDKNCDVENVGDFSRGPNPQSEVQSSVKVLSDCKMDNLFDMWELADREHQGSKGNQNQCRNLG